MIEHDQDRYARALHAVQSGVAAEMAPGPAQTNATDPKHLRVGVSSAMVAQAALARLLIDRGVFTLDEYVAAQADAMEAERREYEQRLSAALGANVTLG